MPIGKNTEGLTGTAMRPRFRGTVRPRHSSASARRITQPWDIIHVALGQSSRADNELRDLSDPPLLLQIRNNERAGRTHAPRVAVHDVERGLHQGGEVDFVDDQEVGAGDAGPPLAWGLVSRG